MSFSSRRCALSMRATSRRFELSRPMRHRLGVSDDVRIDVELVHAARAGDVAALGSLLERHRAALYATALMVLGDPTEANDAVQDTVVTALARLDQLRDPAAVGGWLRATVRNHCLMRVRARRELATAEVDPLPTGASLVEEAVDHMVVADWVWTAIDRLSDDQAVTVMLRFFSRRHASYQEIAAVLDVPVGTVRSRLSQAKDRLADDLLRTAARTNTDHRRLVEARASWWQAAVDQLHRHGTGELYAADCEPDVLVAWPAGDYLERGIDDHRIAVEGTVAAGVRMRVTDVCASRQVTIIEGDYENPPDDPHHCPATHTEIRIHPTGRTRRLLLYYRPHEEDDIDTSDAPSTA
jgi:RNA polymerase sigma factor (sigma-70 family)